MLGAEIFKYIFRTQSNKVWALHQCSRRCNCQQVMHLILTGYWISKCYHIKSPLVYSGIFPLCNISPAYQSFQEKEFSLGFLGTSPVYLQRRVIKIFGDRRNDKVAQKNVCSTLAGYSLATNSCHGSGILRQKKILSSMLICCGSRQILTGILKCWSTESSGNKYGRDYQIK